MKNTYRIVKTTKGQLFFYQIEVREKFLWWFSWRYRWVDHPHYKTFNTLNAAKEYIKVDYQYMKGKEKIEYIPYTPSNK